MTLSQPRRCAGQGLLPVSCMPTKYFCYVHIAHKHAAASARRPSNHAYTRLRTLSCTICYARASTLMEAGESGPTQIPSRPPCPWPRTQSTASPPSCCMHPPEIPPGPPRLASQASCWPRVAMAFKTPIGFSVSSPRPSRASVRIARKPRSRPSLRTSCSHMSRCRTATSPASWPDPARCRTLRTWPPVRR